MMIVNCAVEENKPIPGVLDTGATVNGISHKYISELGITYNSENNSVNTPIASFSTLGKVNLRIGINDGKNHKSISDEFIVVGPDWPDYYPDLVLGMPWFKKNGATLDIRNSKLLLDDNFAIPFEEVNYISTLSDSQIRAMTDFVPFCKKTDSSESKETNDSNHAGLEQ